MRIDIECSRSTWRYAEPFVLSRGAITECDALEVRLVDALGREGRSETCGVTYDGETPESMRAQIESVVNDLRAGATRRELVGLLPPGGARCALDTALWDLESKQGLGDPFSRLGLRSDPVVTAYTIGLGSLERFEHKAAALAGSPWIKVKVDAEQPLAQLEAVHRGAPDAAFIVDPNQAWSVAQLRELAPRLAALGVALLEQPTPRGTEAELDGYRCPIALCADESVDDVDDLPSVTGRFQAINIKLDKVGGLTAALDLADAAQAAGLALMVGCMGGTSLAMAPGMVLAQRCRWVDLDGPCLLSDDRRTAFTYERGVVDPCLIPALWG